MQNSTIPSYNSINDWEVDMLKYQMADATTQERPKETGTAADAVSHTWLHGYPLV